MTENTKAKLFKIFASQYAKDLPQEKYGNVTTVGEFLDILETNPEDYGLIKEAFDGLDDEDIESTKKKLKKLKICVII